jgi:hypothetical protein
MTPQAGGRGGVVDQTNPRGGACDGGNRKGGRIEALAPGDHATRAAWPTGSGESSSPVEGGDARSTRVSGAVGTAMPRAGSAYTEGRVASACRSAMLPSGQRLSPRCVAHAETTLRIPPRNRTSTNARRTGGRGLKTVIGSAASGGSQAARRMARGSFGTGGRVFKSRSPSAGPTPR